MSDAASRHGRRRETLVDFGNNETIATDVARYSWRDPYHAMLTLGWRRFMAMLVGYYVAVNAVFGTLYALTPGSVANLPPGAFLPAFFFSVETFATVGYGVMAPQTLPGHVIATVEIFVGLLSTAVITGLMFVRFSRPRPSLIFARHLTISHFDGVPTLMGRIGNSRASPIVNVEARLVLVARYHTLEGYEQWRPLDLALIRPRAHQLALSMSVSHRIDETSPLHGMTAERLAEMEAQFMLAFTGTDQTLTAPVHAMHAYEPTDVLWGHRFGDMLSIDGAGRTHIELARLNDVVAV